MLADKAQSKIFTIHSLNLLEQTVKKIRVTEWGWGWEGKKEKKKKLIKNHRNMVFFLANNQINEIC